MNMKKSCVLILPLHLFIYLADAYIQSNLQIRTMVVKLTIRQHYASAMPKNMHLQPFLENGHGLTSSR